MKMRASMRTFFNALALTVAFAASAPGATITGDATEVVSDVRHSNGNIYDQVVMSGANATISADPGQTTRISFIDLTDDIVQVEFSGAGALTVTFADGTLTGPAEAQKYNQPGVLYMKGHASLVIVRPDSTTNVSIFSVGTITAQPPALFKTGETYDGVADLQCLTIVNDPRNPAGSQFGGIRAGNAAFWGTSGAVGIAASNIHVRDAVRISDLSAENTAIPVLVFGTESRFGDVVVAGGDVFQPNGKMINTSGGYSFTWTMAEGRTSHNVVLPAQPFRGPIVGGGIP